MSYRNESSYRTDTSPSHIADPTAAAQRIPWRRTAAPWLITFVGFPAGGVAAKAISGRVDDLTAAVLGGLITGVVLGGVQSWRLRRSGIAVWKWIAATGAGLAVGLGVGASVIDYDTSLGKLAVQGLFSGFGVGVAQAWVLRAQLGRLALAWPAVLGGLWALGWSITTSAGIKVEDQWTVFGSTGAITVTVLTAVLPVVLDRRSAS